METPPAERPRFSVVPLRNGAWSLKDQAVQEVCHPAVGPEEEARRLYVEQLRLRERSLQQGSMVVWDVGLGGGANALVALRSLQTVAVRLHLVSFDRSLEAFRFAWEQRALFPYFSGLEAIAGARLERPEEILERRCGAMELRWELRLGDFAGLVRQGGDARLAAPDLLFYDPYSPEANPEMWTLPHFEALRSALAPDRPALLATYSRSSAVRVALLLAGFFVGIGRSTGAKSETTLAASHPALLAEPLPPAWLARVARSHAADPMVEPVFRRRPLQPGWLERLRQHPQFLTAGSGPAH